MLIPKVTPKTRTKSKQQIHACTKSRVLKTDAITDQLSCNFFMFYALSMVSILLSAFKGWEGNVFSLFTTGRGREYPTPRPFPCLCSQVLSVGYLSTGVVPGQHWVPLARTGVPPSKERCTPWIGLGYSLSPLDRLRCGRYASCGFLQEDFLVKK